MSDTAIVIVVLVVCITIASVVEDICRRPKCNCDKKPEKKS